MRTVIRRLARLEDRFAPPDQKPRKLLRIVVSQAGSNAGLDEAECTRIFCEDGTQLEVVDLSGSREGPARLTDEELDRWVYSFPVQVLGNAGSG